MKIGFFDSGLGGLSIQQAVRTELPHYDYEYFGDTKNLPYGDKSEEEIQTLTEAGVRHLFERGALLVVIACNTASAESAHALQERMLTGVYHDRKILGVIIPTVERIIESMSTHTLIVGTKRTITSKKYERELEKRVGHAIQIVGQATPELVPLIESGDEDTALDVLLEYVTPWVGKVNSVVLGCTHYTILKERLRNAIGDSLTIISQDEIIPERLSWYLNLHPEIESRLTRKGTLDMEFSKLTDAYQHLSIRLLHGFGE